MRRWPQGDIDSPPQPFVEQLQHFDYLDPVQMEAALKYRNTEFPFKVYNVPEVTIVYRYCVREGEESNEMLGMGVIGAFVVIRTLSRVRVSSYCDFAPLDCGEPFGYFDWNMIQQAGFSGLESAVMFGATVAAMDYCYKRRIISRFS